MGQWDDFTLGEKISAIMEIVLPIAFLIAMICAAICFFVGAWSQGVGWLIVVFAIYLLIQVV